MGSGEGAGIVVVVSGPSGAGKDTVIQRALELDGSLATVATVKTRAPRSGEVDGVHHIFLSEEVFDEWLAAGKFLEHAEVYGHRSGVPRESVESLLGRGKSVVLRTDVQGARTLRERLEESLLVFVTAPDVSTLRRRMSGRGAETSEEIALRLSHAEAEMSEAWWFDATIVNVDDGAEAAAMELVGLVRAARRRLGDGRG